MLMDDTAIISTSRTAMLSKLKMMIDTCNEIGMALNASKCNYITVGTDVAPLIVDDISISVCQSYTYLGTPISNAHIRKQILAHIDANMPHVNKFSSFVSKNNEAPFTIKHKVWEAAMMSAIMYSCESWLTNEFHSAEGVYYRTIKELLGVRLQTPNLITLVESGTPTITAFIRQRQAKFFQRINALNDPTIPIQQAIKIAKDAKSPMSKVLQCIMLDAESNVATDKASIITKITNTNSSKYTMYRNLNPTLTQPSFYKMNIREQYRIATTRLRTGSHRLKIETGRWARLPRENRLCECGEVQDEIHVLEHCTLLAEERINLSIPNIIDTMNNNPEKLVKFCHIILTKFN
jgi:hypothetical protein